MGLVKGLLLGSAAGVVMATGSAFAADLPSRKAAPVAYVKICDVYGRGFYYIPGTNTCLRVGGRVRVEYGYYHRTNFYRDDRGTVAAATGAKRRLDHLGWKARGYVNMDSRTQTAWGTVQAVFSLAIRSRSATFNAGGQPAAAAGRTTASTQVYAAYIRFAGFTFGRARHNHSFMPPFTYNTTYSAGGAIGALQLAYTATFGGGFSATIALEDQNDYASMVSHRVTGIGPAGGLTYPNRLPVLVGNVRVDQGWGSAMLAAAVGQWRGVTGNAVVNSYKRTGFFIGGGIRINLPMLARGDRLDMAFSYATGGLLSYAYSGGWMTGSAAKDGAITYGFSQRMAGVAVRCFNAAGTVCRTGNNRAWTLAAIFTHYWTPTLRSHFGASYLNYRTHALARTGGVTPLTGGQAGGTAWEVTHNLVWAPSRGFNIGLELQYRKVNNKLPAGNIWPAAFVTPVGVLRIKRNPSIFVGKLRVQKTW